MRKSVPIAILLIFTATLACKQEEPEPEAKSAGPVTIQIDLPDAQKTREIDVEHASGTVFALMQKASEKNLLSFEYEGEGEKAFIQSIEGVSPEGDTKESRYWIYAINGKLANTGVGSQTVNPGDTIRWCYLSYDERKSCGETTDNEAE